MMHNLLVVCEGNVCRSPMAAAFMRAAMPVCNVTSAGWSAMVDAPAALFAQEVMRARGLTIEEHRGRQLDLRVCLDADLILVMDRRQRALLEDDYPLARGKIFRLGQFQNVDIHDPYRHPRFVFERCARLIEACVADWQVRLNAV